MPRKYHSAVAIVFGILFLLMVTVPYYWAFQSMGETYHFGGFLLNPIDGNSYLAKMYQGWLGNWRFHLPYTAEPGEGGYLFIFYLGLGQIARFLGWSLIFTFHSGRILGAGLMVFSLWRFFGRVLPTERAQWFAYVLALFGSGMGWIGAMFGFFSADFWVAEGYPFLAGYANPHFPLGIAIMILILTPQKDTLVSKWVGRNWFQAFLIICSSIILGILLPFGSVVVILILAGVALWDLSGFLAKKGQLRNLWSEVFALLRASEGFRKLIWVVLGGLPVLIYEYWITNKDPIFSVWNEQNLTLAPSPLDLLLSFSPLIILSLLGIRWVWRNRETEMRVIVVWAVLGLILLYFPWNLQRRFILGYMIPLAGLASIALDRIFFRHRGTALILLCLTFLLFIPTNLMIVAGGLQAVNAQEPGLGLSSPEMKGLDWLKSNSPQDGLVLASPEMGLFIPAYTGRRVLYGHPFETVNAAEMVALVENLLLNLDNPVQDLELYDISYVFFGPRERELTKKNLEPDFLPAFESGDVQIFDVEDILSEYPDEEP